MAVITLPERFRRHSERSSTVPDRPGAHLSPPALAGAVVASLAALAVLVAARPGTLLVRVEVVGDSMAPELLAGDRVLVVACSVRVGDVVALEDPTCRSRLLVKRLSRLGHDGRLEVVGDNASSSTDSRTFGPVPRSLVKGRALYRYHPPARAGFLARSQVASGASWHSTTPPWSTSSHPSTPAR